VTRDDERAGTSLRRAALPLLPSLLTIGNLLCGWAVVVHALRGDLGGAAPFVALAILFDLFDGRIARLTGTTSAFGAQLDSLADLVSFGVAPALLAYRWGLEPLGALGWLAGAAFLTAAALRLARFNVHAAAVPSDDNEQPVEALVGAADPGSHFSGLPSPAAAAVIAATVLMAPAGLHTMPSAVLALAVTLVPAALMVSTLPFRSFKSVHVNAGRTAPLVAVACLVAVFALVEPHAAFLVAAYAYLTSGLVEFAA